MGLRFWHHRPTHSWPFGRETSLGNMETKNDAQFPKIFAKYGVKQRFLGKLLFCIVFSPDFAASVLDRHTHMLWSVEIMIMTIIMITVMMIIMITVMMILMMDMMWPLSTKQGSCPIVQLWGCQMAARARGHKCTRLNAKYYIFTALENIKLAACLVQKITFSPFLWKILHLENITFWLHLFTYLGSSTASIFCLKLCKSSSMQHVLVNP